MNHNNVMAQRLLRTLRHAAIVAVFMVVTAVGIVALLSMWVALL